MDATGDALNYPYIRVGNVNWLKSTLLLFPHVARIRPAMDAPPDDPEIEVFTHVEGARNLPLLRSFEADHATWDNHERLREDLRRALELGGDRLRRRFSRAATEADAPKLMRQSVSVWGDRMANRTFQIHSDKIFPPLLNLLMNAELAWNPRHAHGSHYVEMHPTIGEGVMASLAFAVAKSRGCQLVTEFPEIYSRTIQSNVDDVFSAITSSAPPGRSIPLFRKRGTRIAEAILYQRCDVERLDIESLAMLSKEQEALADFRGAVEQFAANIPDEISDEGEINSYVEDRAQAVIEKWREGRRSLGLLGKIFGEETEDALKDLAKDGFKDAATAGGGALFLAPTGHALLGAGAGLAIGLAFRTLGGSEKKAASAKAPLRYLTKLQKHGVAVAVNGGHATAV